MATWKLNPMAESVRRKIGNLVFYPLPSGRVISRARVIPTNPMTEYQQDVRVAQSAASQVWLSTSAAERDVWNEYAGYYIRYSKDGNPYTLNGRSFCTMLNFWSILQGSGPTTTCPAESPPIIPGAIASFERNLLGTEYVLTYNYPAEAGGDYYAVVRLAKPLTGGRKVFQESDYRFPTTDPADSMIALTSLTPGPQTLSFSVGTLKPGLDTILAAAASAGDVEIGLTIDMLTGDFTPQIPKIGVSGNLVVEQET